MTKDFVLQEMQDFEISPGLYASQLGRFNFEILLRNKRHDNSRIYDASLREYDGFRIGWFYENLSRDLSLYTTPYPKSWFVPHIIDLLRMGARIHWLGANRKNLTINRAVDCYGETTAVLNKLYRDKPSEESNKEFARRVLDNYKKYGIKFPELDAVFLCPIACQFLKNLLVWLILYHYSKSKTRICLVDLEFRWIGDSRYGVSTFSFDGTKNVFSVSELAEMRKYINFFLFMHDYDIEKLKQKTGTTANLVSYFLPVDCNLGFMSPTNKPERDLTYVGFDFSRRKYMEKYLEGIGKLKRKVAVYGGSFWNRKDFDPEFIAKMPNVYLHNAVDRCNVTDVYRNSLCVLNIVRDKYMRNGWIVARIMEALLGGSVVVLPCEFASKSWSLPIVSTASDLSALMERLKTKSNGRVSIIEKQRRDLLPRFSTDLSLRKILGAA